MASRQFRILGRTRHSPTPLQDIPRWCAKTDMNQKPNLYAECREMILALMRKPNQMSTEPKPSAVTVWLQSKLAEAEKSLRSREQMAESFERCSDPKYWEGLAKIPGVIVTKTYRGRKAPTVEESKQSAASQRRIAGKCRNEVEMLKRIIDRETGAGDLAAALSDAWTIINVLHMAQMDQAEVWPRALEWLQANEKYKP